MRFAAVQQTVAMLDRETGEASEKTLKHDGDAVRAFYAYLPAPVLVGIDFAARDQPLIAAAETQRTLSASRLKS